MPTARAEAAPVEAEVLAEAVLDPVAAAEEAPVVEAELPVLVAAADDDEADEVTRFTAVEVPHWTAAQAD